MNVQNDCNIDWLKGLDFGIRYDSDKLFHKSIELNSRAIIKSSNKKKTHRVPIWKRANLTVEEAADYFGIGIHKITELTEVKNCPFVLWNGNKRLIKREAFEKYLENQYSI